MAPLLLFPFFPFRKRSACFHARRGSARFARRNDNFRSADALVDGRRVRVASSARDYRNLQQFDFREKKLTLELGIASVNKKERKLKFLSSRLSMKKKKSSLCWQTHIELSFFCMRVTSSSEIISRYLFGTKLLPNKRRLLTSYLGCRIFVGTMKIRDRKREF